MLDLPDHKPQAGQTPFAGDSDVQDYISRITRIANDYEFESFTTGTILHVDLADQDAVQVKRDLNRRVALGVYALLPGREPTREKSDITFLLHYPGSRIDVMPSPLYVYGRYLKFTRDLPQAKWLCLRCKGKGCHECGGKGKVFESSVEEIIAAPMLNAFRAEGAKMHATGRQDVDVRMLGTGRPFAIEIIRPRKRATDLEILRERINRSTQAVEVGRLRYASRRIAREIDTARADKTYRAIVAAARPVDAAELTKLDALSGATIHQRTPLRVAHRRADKIRDRTVRQLSTRLPEGAESSQTFEIELRTETGTYVKEMISGDCSRTRPSVAEILGTVCVCRELDVTDVDFDPYCGR